ncbi:MAG: hypothetical protein IPI97_03090 [Nitrosomonas sp.]|nr:hypothetical protein [Nitrosomonas sp.]
MLLTKRLFNLMTFLLLVSLYTFSLALSSVNVHAASSAELIQSGVTAYQAIGTLRKETPINGDAIAAAYAGDLQTLTHEVDEANVLELNNDIQGAINDIKNGKSPVLAAQVVDKTLQRVFYQIIWNRIAAIRNEFQSGAPLVLVNMLNEAEAAFNAIKGTVARENRVLTVDRQSITTGDNPGLDAEILDQFARVRTALNKTNADEDFIVVQIARYAIRMSLARAYYIGVLREVAAVIDNRNSDIEETLEVLKEGEIFYRVIEPLVSNGNPAGNLIIKSQLVGNPSKVIADEIVSELGKGFISRVLAETGGQERAITEGNRPQAVAEAAGAKYFARVLFPDLELRLGSAVLSNLENELENLLTASNELSATNSKTARDAIIAILNQYESALTRSKYTVAKPTELIENAVASFQEIGVLRNQSPADADAIAQKYSGDLKSLTQIVDQIYGLTIDQDVSAAINQVKNGNNTALALQVIDKSLQRVFAIVVYNRVVLAAEQFPNLSTDELLLEWDRAYSAYLAIARTADREEKILTTDKKTITSGRNPDLDYQILSAFVQGKRALSKANNDDQASIALAQENIIIPLVRSFLIGVLREVEGIISDRDGNVDEAREKQIEGEYFYRIVEGFISQANLAGSNLIKTQLTGSLATVEADAIVKEISKGILGQLKRNITQVEANFGNDKNKALLAREELALLAGIFLSDLELRLGALQRVRLENSIRNLKEAILTEDSSQAIATRAVMIEVIANYESKL